MRTHTFKRVLLGGLLSAGGVVVACYNPDPNAIDGRLRCASTGKQCPDGFVCNEQNLCVTSGALMGGAGGVGGMGGMGPGGAGGIPETGGMGGGMQCVGPLPQRRCQLDEPMVGVCDPACQRGCACENACSVNEMGPVCVVQTGTKEVGEECSTTLNDCAPGSICLQDLSTAPQCGSHCFRFCRYDVDCPRGAHCTTPLAGGSGDLAIKVCDNPPELCSPIYGRGECLAMRGRDSHFACYLMGPAGPNEAVCDCAGDIPEGQPCTHERSCQRGHICVKADMREFRCHRVCPLGDPTAVRQICGATGLCVAYPGSSRFGYCSTTGITPLPAPGG